MKDLFLLTDYRGRFGSKHKETTFRSGFDLSLLKRCFQEKGFRLIMMQFSEVNFRDNWKGKIVLYSSAEDSKGLYKSYIEDIIYGLDRAEAFLIPGYPMLKAHNNKVFMEILRDIYFPNDRILSHKYGNREELLNSLHMLSYPVVIKSYEGAVSRNVRMCYNKEELLRVSETLMRTPDPVYELKELYRSRKRPPYKPESKFRKKAVVQNMIEGLSNDWKVLAFGNKLYKLKRLNRVGDPRASGSGRFIFDRAIDEDILDFASSCYQRFNVPVVSLDIAKDNQGCILIEFQFVTFGTKTLEKADHYYIYSNGKWSIVQDTPILEKEFVQSYSDFFERNQLFLS